MTLQICRLARSSTPEPLQLTTCLKTRFWIHETSASARLRTHARPFHDRSVVPNLA